MLDDSNSQHIIPMEDYAKPFKEKLKSQTLDLFSWHKSNFIRKDSEKILSSG
jgi:hypothetical protein